LIEEAKNANMKVYWEPPETTNAQQSMALTDITPETATVTP
jgi:hypothetical protein